MSSHIKQGMAFRAESVVLIGDKHHHLKNVNVGVLSGWVYCFKINGRPYYSNLFKMQIVLNGEILFDSTI